MTNDEAIRKLVALQDGNGDMYEAIRMAIEALSAQPGCEDAVSRADVDILIEETETARLKGDILFMYPALKKGLQKVPPRGNKYCSNCGRCMEPQEMEEE